MGFGRKFLFYYGMYGKVEKNGNKREKGHRGRRKSCIIQAQPSCKASKKLKPKLNSLAHCAELVTDFFLN